MQEKKKILCSFSGGSTSGMLTFLLLEECKDEDEYEIVIVFANTGEEHWKTLQFVHFVDKYIYPQGRWRYVKRGKRGRKKPIKRYFGKIVWVEASVKHGKREGTTHTIVDYKSASRKGEPFEEVIKKYGIPNQAYPHCTRELKQRPIHSYVKNQLGWKDYTTAIGIRSDEMDRVADNYKALGYWYPLLDKNINKEKVNAFWEKMPFKLEIPNYLGNCVFCWKKTIAKLLKISKEEPTAPKWWNRMEELYSHHAPRRDTSKAPFYFGRRNRSIKEILAADVEIIADPQIDLFEFGCSESCEAF